MARIQYDLDDAWFERAKPFILDPKYRHAFAEKAFREWITRQEGRKRRSERAQGRQK